MSACHEILDLISASLDNQLSEAEHTMLNEHLHQCPACSALFDELQGLHTAAAQLEDIPAPEGFSSQVMARIAADPTLEKNNNVITFPTKKSIYHSWKKWAVSAAALAIVILGAATLPGQMRMDGRSPANDSLLTADSIGEQSVSQSESSDLGPLNGNSGKIKDEETKYGQQIDSLYCGTLTLMGAPLPDGLEQYDHTIENGDLVYVVPSDYFFSLKEMGFFSVDSNNLVFGPPDAPTGRIIVRCAP